MLNGGVVSWKSSKRETTTNSTTEAEYIAVSEAAKEDVWIKKFVTELGVVPSALGPLELYCDKRRNLDRIRNQSMFYEDITLFVRLSKELMFRFAK
jgi:hypothetical protein